jgi:hypothetical protein
MCNERLKPPSLAKYFFAFTTSDRAFHRESERLVTEKLGALDVHSEIISFSDFSTYYDEELGGHCWKYLVSLDELKPVDQLVGIKLFTEEVEAAFARRVESGRKRTVNIDPGFLTGWQVVLASVKNQAHRLYAGQGVYYEVTLLYRDKGFQPLPWTYRDYLSSPVLDFLNRVRAEYRKQL